MGKKIVDLDEIIKEHGNGISPAAAAALRAANEDGERPEEAKSPPPSRGNGATPDDVKKTSTAL